MKIAILGAAGVRTPLIVQAMAERQSKTGLTELALMDIDGERLEVIRTLNEAVLANGSADLKVTHTTDARAALINADFVITTFRVGGIESRVIDERVPLRVGVLGQETTGPGGFAMGMRTIPVLMDYIKLMHEVCPKAWLINFANPAGMLAETALRAADWKRAVGICDAPTGMLRVAAAMLQVSLDEVTLDYFGLNHLGWVRGVMYQGKNMLPVLMKMLEQAGGMPGLPFEMSLIRSLGMIPNEYLYYYYTRAQAVDNILRGEQTRGEQIAELNVRLFTQLKSLRETGNIPEMMRKYYGYLDERGDTYMTNETGKGHSDMDAALKAAMDTGGYAAVALDLIEGLVGSGTRIMTLNILNQGAIAGMKPDDSVEVPAVVSKGSVRPLAVGEIPSVCLGLMQQVKAYEHLTIDAAIEGSYAKALHALTIHPLVGDAVKARTILDGYRLEHGALFPKLQ